MQNQNCNGNNESKDDEIENQSIECADFQIASFKFFDFSPNKGLNKRYVKPHELWGCHNKTLIQFIIL